MWTFICKLWCISCVARFLYIITLDPFVDLLFYQCYLARCQLWPVSVTSRCSVKMDGQIKLVLAWGLPSSYPIVCYRDIRVSAQLRVLPCGADKTVVFGNSPRYANRRRKLWLVSWARQRWVLSVADWTSIRQLCWQWLWRSTAGLFPNTRWRCHVNWSATVDACSNLLSLK